MVIRKANKDDKGDIASLIYSSGPEYYDFIYKTNTKNPKEYIDFEFKSGKGFCGYNNVTVGVKNGEVVATGCFYDGKNYDKLTMGTLVNMIKFYGLLKVWAVLKRSSHIVSVMKKPKTDELYLANFGVSEKLRSTGIGSTIIKNKIEEAKLKGYRLFSLDVADTNPRAEKLYTNLGLQVIKYKVFTGKREGVDVPNGKKMEFKLKG